MSRNVKVIYEMKPEAIVGSDENKNVLARKMHPFSYSSSSRYQIKRPKNVTKFDADLIIGKPHCGTRRGGRCSVKQQTNFLFKSL